VNLSEPEVLEVIGRLDQAARGSTEAIKAIKGRNEDV